MDLIARQGAGKWFARQKEMALRTRAWAGRHFAVFTEPGYESISLTAISNTRKISVAELNQKLGERGMAISNGYGKLKEQTFRIGHMGDIGMGDLEQLLSAIGEILKL